MNIFSRYGAIAATVAFLAAIALAGCTPAEEQKACAVDAVVAPVGQAIGTASGGVAAGAAAVDAALAHPIVTEACAGLTAPKK